MVLVNIIMPMETSTKVILIKMKKMGLAQKYTKITNNMKEILQVTLRLMENTNLKINQYMMEK